MIIKSKPRSNGGKLADYLLKEQKNERAELLEMRGFRGTLKGALGREEELAETQTRCEQPFYHVSFRAAPGEELTPEQWQYCADKLEKRLGLENNHRAIVLQTHEGEQHMHVVWSRIDPETLKAVNLYRDRYHCKEVARELERELGLQKVRNHKREDERELAAPSFGEDQEARRKGQDLKETRAAIREAWEKSEDGRSFAAALKERGLELAQGDRRDFVAVDERGSVHSIGKRTTGASAAEVREKLADLDRERIPTVERVREEQKREREQAQEREGKEQNKERGQTREQAKTERFLKRQDEIKAELLKRQEAEREQLKKRMEERGKKLADWGRDKGQQITAELRDRQKADRATLETRMDEKKLNWIDKARLRLELEKTQEREREDAERRKEKLELAITRTERRRIEENTRRARDQQERHADQRAKLEIRQAEIREQYGIKAPDRDEAAREAKRERERLGFARAARESGGDVTRTAPQRQPEPEREQKPRSAADRLDDAVTTVLGGLADFFVGGTPAPKQQKTRSQEMKEEMERLKTGRKDPRYKTIAEWQAEARYERQVEIERRASLTPEQRREEDRQREEERARERERDRERGGRSRERER